MWLQAVKSLHHISGPNVKKSQKEKIYFVNFLNRSSSLADSFLSSKISKPCSLANEAISRLKSLISLDAMTHDDPFFFMLVFFS